MSETQAYGPGGVDKPSWRGLSMADKTQYVEQYSPLIRYLADRLASRLPGHIVKDDLISAGVLGLIDAIDRFEADRGIMFKTYAEFRIKGSMIDELRSLDWVPRTVRKKANELEKLLRKLEQELGHPPSDEETAAAMGITVPAYLKLLDEVSAVNIGFIGGAGWNVGVLYDQFPFQGDPLGWDYATLPVRDPNNTYAVPMSAGASYYVSAQLRNDKDKLAKINHVIRLFCGDERQSVLFTAGKNLPLRPDIIAKAAPAERPQWTSYGRAAPATVTLPIFPTDLLAPEGADRTAVFSQILTGQIKVGDVRAALTDLDARYNAALQQAYSRNVIKESDFLDPTLEARFRAK